MGFYLCKEGLTGEAIKNLILKTVADLGLSMNDCRGQCYDGAGNMAGHFIEFLHLLRTNMKRQSTYTV